MTVTETLESTQTAILGVISDSHGRVLDVNSKIAALVTPRISAAVSPRIAPVVPVVERQMNFFGDVVEMNRTFATKMVNAWRPETTPAPKAATKSAPKKPVAKKPAAKRTTKKAAASKASTK